MSPPSAGPSRPRYKLFVYQRRSAIDLYRRFWICFLVILSLDQITKIWVVLTIPYPTYHFPGPIPVLPGFLYWVHIGNQGAAWGMLQDYPFFLLGLALVSLLAIYIFRHPLGLTQPKLQITFGILCGGIFGNVLDRMLYGHVVDFIDVHLPLIGYRWPAFNVADSAIVTGVLLYLYFSLREPVSAE